ncbi:MAG: hypothetical protein JSS76_14375 [Bacteroidetes bacterium]|nr:hypothetical protein [Bacteroidota bacterium]
MRHVLFILLLFVSGYAMAQNDDLTFRVKRRTGPITTGWFSFDTLRTDQLYQIAISDPSSGIGQDSILCLRMECRKYKDTDGVEYLLFGSRQPVKAYIALYSQNVETKQWRQNSMRPVVFTPPPVYQVISK